MFAGAGSRREGAAAAVGANAGPIAAADDRRDARTRLPPPRRRRAPPEAPGPGPVGSGPGQLRCSYGEAIALADLRAAGTGDDFIGALTADPPDWPADVRPVVAFAFTLTRAGHEVTDAEVAELIDRYGEKQVVAIVLLLAYANFQDRLPWRSDRIGTRRPPAATGREVRPSAAGGGCARPPAEAARDPRRTRSRAASGAHRPSAGPGRHPRPRWRSSAAACRGFACPSRTRGSTGGAWSGRRTSRNWPTAWSACTQAFGEEADQDPVFEQSLFWVVTRTQAVLLLNGAHRDGARGRGPGRQADRGTGRDGSPAATGPPSRRPSGPRSGSPTNRPRTRPPSTPADVRLLVGSASARSGRWT